jgi:ubiquinone/menaquinone biosynthesis C-methylase UbiE
MPSLNNQFYKNSYNKYGTSAKGLHWNSKETQFLRFEIITNYIQSLKDSSIIDIGCGFGDYLVYIKEQNMQIKNYLGLDCEDFLIKIALQKHQNTKFLLCNFLKEDIPNADYLICSGGLNLLNKKEFLFAIKKCFEVSNKGFVFNFLINKSLHELSEEEIYFYCKGLSSKVIISEDYLFNDSTIYIEK